ncbi:MAG TPA: glycerophosphodiester phosphodiesterase family protein [Xanthobacteraceae bacterium]|nr:glycerophosphodiester phosphodiesterase family protein [Xanthobacteraceae bacterium]
MAAPDWLTARPIAHRGLHDAAAGIIENMPAAAEAAMAGRYAIECDVQLSADGQAMVFHDDALDRLTLAQGPLSARTAQALQGLAFRGTAERMMSLPDLLARVAGRVPLLIELKSAFDGHTGIAERTVAVLAAYAGPAALMSFDPDLVAAVRRLAPHLPRGFTMERRYTDPEWDGLSAAAKFSYGHVLHAPRTRPDFLAHYVKELPAPVPWLARHLFGRPVLTWTVRSEADRVAARAYADQMIFEGFRP